MPIEYIKKGLYNRKFPYEVNTQKELSAKASGKKLVSYCAMAKGDT